MSDPVGDVVVLERVRRIAPLGVRLRDVATGLIANRPLDARVTTETGTREIPLGRNSRGVWYAHRLPGLRDVDLDPQAGSVPPRTYRLAVDDPDGDYLPLRHAIVLPHRGLVEWDGWSGLPADPLAPLRDEAGGVPCPGSLPIFSSPARRAPAGLAEVRGQLQRADTGAPVPWALVTARDAAGVRGLALADSQGRFALFFAYPEWPRANLGLGSPPPGPTDPAWPVGYAAYSSLLPADPVPSLAGVLAQLDHPRDLYASTQSPLAPLAAQPLHFGRPLTLKTEQTPDGPSSFLIMAAA